jgi:hypothetical protein
MERLVARERMQHYPYLFLCVATAISKRNAPHLQEIETNGKVSRQRKNTTLFLPVSVCGNIYIKENTTPHLQEVETKGKASRQRKNTKLFLPVSVCGNTYIRE